MQFAIKQIFLLCQQETCFFVDSSRSYNLLTARTVLIEKDIGKVSL